MKWIHLFLMKPMARLVGFLFSKDGAIFSISVAIHSLANLLVNIVLAAYLTSHTTILWSCIWIFCASTLKVIILISIYDYFKTDVFKLETFKQGQIGTNKFIRIAKNITHKFERYGKIFSHIVLISLDHVVGVIYIRKEHHVYRGIPRQDWLAILIAMIISAPSIVLGWEALYMIWRFIKLLIP